MFQCYSGKFWRNCGFAALVGKGTPIFFLEFHLYSTKTLQPDLRTCADILYVLKAVILGHRIRHSVFQADFEYILFLNFEEILCLNFRLNSPKSEKKHRL